MTEKKWMHDELQEDLARHLRGSTDRLVWTNMPMGSAGTFRPDVYTIEKSFVRFHPIAYEIKISVGDFRSDVTSGKWQKYLEVANGVVFAVPSGLIDKEELPKGCGLIVRHENGWRMAKKPSLSHLDTLPRDTWIKLLISGIERTIQSEQFSYKAKTFSEYRAVKTLSKKFGEEIGFLLSKRRDSIMALNNEIERINTDTEMQKIRHSEFIETEKARERQYNQIKIELCKFLNIGEESSIYLMQRKASEFIDGLKNDEEVKRLNRTIANISNAFNNVKTTEEFFKTGAKNE